MALSRFHAIAALALTASLFACQLDTVRGDQLPTLAPTLIPAAPPGSAPAPDVQSSPQGGQAPAEVGPQIGVWLHPGLPPAVVGALAPLFANPAFVRSDTPEGSSVQVTLLPGGGAPLAANWVYAVVAPFPTVPDEIGWEALGRYWQGDPNALPDFGAPHLVLSQDVFDLLSAIYGPPGQSVPVAVVPVEQVLDQAWANPSALSVVPFESLEPRWKVLSVDGQSPLNKTLNLADYHFSVGVGLAGDPEAVAQATEAILAGGAWRPSNFDPSRMTVVTMTGVTALSRAVAWTMERSGIVEQGAGIKPLLADADILHVSNEVAFALDCPPPEPTGEPKFCSDDRYMALLQDLGPDVIELTGNHINDWGTDALLHTIDLYDQDGMLIFGGGRNLEEAKRTLVVESFGNRIAFLGCNLPGPSAAWATDQTPGAAPCEDYVDFNARVAAAREQADVVIVTQQYYEFEHAEPTGRQSADFGAIVDAGADIVSGSQAHLPQTMAFHSGRFVHYGLSNLFFDPFEDVKKQLFIDKHIIYEGRHISTVLLTGRIEDYGRPVPMSPDERREFLTQMFALSGW